jgi:uncharacterized protein YggE
MLQKLLAVTALSLAPFAASASQLPDYPFIHVTGTAIQYVVPDIGTLDFEILASDPDPAAARSVVETRVAEVRTLLEGQGLSLDDAEVRDVRQEIRRTDHAATAPVYDLRCVVHINVRDLSKWRALAGGLLAMPNLDGFSTAFDASGRDKVDMDLAADAIRDARRRGEAMAAGFGRKLGPLMAVTAGSLKNLGSAMGLVREDFTYRREASAQKVDRGDILNVVVLKLAQPVDVIFRIK